MKDVITIGSLEIPDQEFILVNTEESLDGAYFIYNNNELNVSCPDGFWDIHFGSCGFLLI